MSKPPSPSDTELAAYLDGELPETERAAITAHLAQSPDDARRMAAWTAQDHALREAFNPVLNEPLPLRLRGQPIAPAKQGFGGRARLVAAIAFLAGLGIGAIGAAGFLSREKPVVTVNAPADMLGQRALAAYRTFAVEVRHPVEVPASDEAHLVQWLSKRLDYKLRIPDLTGEGFRLLGGRLLAGEDGPAALLLYENAAGERVSLYCGHGSKAGATAFRYADSPDAGAFYWVDADAAYALSGPPNRDRLMRIAHLVYATLEGEKPPI
jgi:anti-sigma factor RsiW